MWGSVLLIPLACREFWAPGVLAQGYEAEAAV